MYRNFQPNKPYAHHVRSRLSFHIEPRLGIPDTLLSPNPSIHRGLFHLPRPPIPYPASLVPSRHSHRKICNAPNRKSLPTGKASQDDLRRLFSKPGSHIFKDATVPISLVGPHVVKSLFCHSSNTLEIHFLLPKALSGCHVSDLDSLLRVAADGGRSYFVAALIDAGADPNRRINSSDSILSLAIRSGDSESVRTLIESGYSMDPSDRLLHDAAEINRVDLLKILHLAFEDINLNLTDSLGQTALHVAVMKGNFKVLRFLISIGCRSNITDLNGWTPLHYAASGRYVELAELLVSSSICGKDVVSKDGDTPFSLAVKKGCSELYDSLHLGDVLHRAARVGDVREIRRCLADGAKVNSKDQNGWTPLHRAAFKGRIECVKVLLNNGAQADDVESCGRTAIQLAAEAGHLQIVMWLSSHGAKAKGKIVKGFEMGRSGLDCFKNHPSIVATFCQEKERA